MSSDWPRPSRMERRVRSRAVEPRPFVRSMTVGRLPDFADPALLPSRPARCRAREAVRWPCVGSRRMLQHAAAAVHRVECEPEASTIIAGFVVVATLMRPIGGYLADRYGGAQVLAFVLGLIAIFALGLMSANMVFFTIGALGTAALLGTGNGTIFRLVPEYFPRETGTVTGLVGAAGGLGGFFPPLILGVIRSATGSYTLGFVFLACFAVICLATNYLIFLRPRDELRAGVIAH